MDNLTAPLSGTDKDKLTAPLSGTDKDKLTAQQLSNSPEETFAFGASLGRLLQAGDVVLLVGELGAGKTQLAKGIASGLGVLEPVTSPTFNIMLVYQGSNGRILNHIDLYRLDESAQLEDIDYFGSLESNAVSVVEWGDKFSDALPAEYLAISFATDDSGVNVRSFNIVTHGPRATQLFMDWLDEVSDRGLSSETSSGARS